MPKVSVIIPVYNSERYISECLDSVLNQTLVDIEILCIDDCSNDSSKSLLDKYSQIDKRVKILQNENNMGQSFSRNRAIEFACGEYIQFLDSDDYLSDNKVLESLYYISHENDLDLLKSRIFVLENEVLNEYILYPECVANNVYSGKELLFNLEFYNVCIRNTTSNFVRRDFVIKNEINFCNGIIHEDVLYSYDVYYYAKRAMCVNRHTYIYVKRENSTTTQPQNINHLKGYLEGMHKILNREFVHDSVDFHYATIKYFLRMQRNAINICDELKVVIEPEIFDDDLRKLYNIFIWDSQSLINHEMVNQNLKKIIQSEKLYIYGAGKAAQELLKILGKYDISIDGVFVTNTENSAKMVLGHKVMGIDTYVHSNMKILFLVAITKRYVGDTVELLRSRGIENIIYVC